MQCCWNFTGAMLRFAPTATCNVRRCNFTSWWCMCMMCKEAAREPSALLEFEAAQGKSIKDEWSLDCGPMKDLSSRQPRILISKAKNGAPPRSQRMTQVLEAVFEITGMHWRSVEVTNIIQQLQEKGIWVDELQNA